MPKKKKSKSADQHIWKELLIQPELFAPVIDIEDATDNEAAVLKEAKILIQQLLFDRVVEIASKKFTDHQKVVLALIQSPGRTYNEVAGILGINYTGVSHAIKGIKSNKHGGKFHGGYERKLQKFCQSDDECQTYIDHVKELRNNDPLYALSVLIEHDDDPTIWIKLRDKPSIWKELNFWEILSND